MPINVLLQAYLDNNGITATIANGDATITSSLSSAQLQDLLRATAVEQYEPSLVTGTLHLKIRTG